MHGVETSVINMDRKVVALTKRPEIYKQMKDDLIEASEIYKYIHPLLENNSNLLYIEFLSRLKNRSNKYARKFIESSKICLINGAFKMNDFVRLIFILDTNSTIHRFYFQHDGPFAFIHSRSSNNSQLSTLFVVNSISSKKIGFYDFECKAKCMQIIYHQRDDTTKQIDKLSDLDLNVYFYSSENIYSSNLITKSCIMDNLNGKFIKLLLLNSNYLLVATSQSIILLDLREYTIDTGFSFKRDEEIDFLESTIPKETVYSSQYLNSFNTKMITVGFKMSGIVRIYKFDNNNEKEKLHEINSIKWNYFAYPLHQPWNDICMDTLCMFDNNTRTESNNDGPLIRFCLKEGDFIKIVVVQRDGKVEINRFNEIEIAIKISSGWIGADGSKIEDHKNTFFIEDFQSYRLILKDTNFYKDDSQIVFRWVYIYDTYSWLRVYF